MGTKKKQKKVRKKPPIEVKKRKPIKLNWKQIIVIISFLMLYHMILVLYSLGIFIGAYNTQSQLGQFVDLISDNSDGTVITVLLAIAGLICLCFSCLAVFCLIKSLRVTPSPALNKWLRVHVFSTFGLVLILFIIAISIVSHAYALHEGLEDGIVRAMKEYKTNTDKKVIIDKLQIKFQCCGSLAYKEWFEIEWYDPLVGGAMKSSANKTVLDSTPFSCCLIGVLFPCVHHHLLNRSDIYKFPQDKPFSISTEGCHTTLKERTRSTSRMILLVLFGIGFLEIFGGIGMRIIQTAHRQYNCFGRNTNALHLAWLCRKPPDDKLIIPPEPPPIPSFLEDE